MAHKVRAHIRIASAPVWVNALLAALVIGTSGCAGAAETDGQAPVEARVVSGATAPTIFGGDKDDDRDSIDGVVALRVGAGSSFELCSGALIAPNLVLTARHCVTKNITTSVSCDENGRSANGKHVSADEPPASVGVYVGASPSFAKAPLAMAKAIMAPGGAYLCDSDIALVVLETAITTVAPIPVRIRSAARKGERIRAVGYGQNDKSSPIGTRFRKGGVPVLAQGSVVSASKTPLGAHEFEVGKSICQGDSGGPAISEETGAVIGVVSRGGGCEEDFGHIYTTTSGFDALFADAFAMAGHEPTEEEGGLPASVALARARSAQANDPIDDETNGGPKGCSVGRLLNHETRAPEGRTGATGSTGASGLVLVAAALTALRARRRRSV